MRFAGDDTNDSKLCLEQSQRTVHSTSYISRQAVSAEPSLPRVKSLTKYPSTDGFFAPSTNEGNLSLKSGAVGLPWVWLPPALIHCEQVSHLKPDSVKTWQVHRHKKKNSLSTYLKMSAAAENGRGAQVYGKRLTPIGELVSR